MDFMETTLTDEPAVDENADPTYFTGKDETVCVIDDCYNQRKPYRGRGKRPTKCEAHSQAGTGSRGNTVAAGRSTAWKDKMYVQTATLMVGLGALVGRFNETDGKIVVNGAPNFCQAVVDTAEADPKFRKAVESMMKGNAYFTLGMAAASIALPILANHNMVPGKIGEMLSPKLAENVTHSTAVD